MLKNTIYIALLLTLTSGIADIASNSAPASSSGAPGEVDCTTSGCHSDFAVNSGTGIATLTIDSSPTMYIPGKTYTLSVEISQSNLNRFGFQLIALRDQDNSNVGTLKVTDAARNQIISGYGSLLSRKYMTYTYLSTSSVSNGKGAWSFEWTAPSTDVGPITFYLATLAANNNGTDQGDYCYTKSLQLASLSNGIATKSDDIQLNIFPNPVSDKLNIHYVLNSVTDVRMEMFDVAGNKLDQLFYGNQTSGEHTVTLELKKRYANGNYLFAITKDGQRTVKKILITN